MNSYIKPPVGQTRKFQFDTDFGSQDEQDDVSDMSSSPPPVEEAPVIEPPPQFTLEQMHAAQEAGFQQGFQQAADEFQRSDHKTLAELTAQMVGKLDLLATGEDRRMQGAQEIALQTTLAAIKKLLPTIVQQLGLPLIESAVRQSMESNPDETRIVVRVHDRMLDAVIERLPQLQAQQAFAGKVIVLADPSVQVGDCKVEWADGGMERLMRGLTVQIDHAMERIIASLPQASKIETR